jgi:hypothetical protein
MANYPTENLTPQNPVVFGPTTFEEQFMRIKFPESIQKHMFKDVALTRPWDNSAVVGGDFVNFPSQHAALIQWENYLNPWDRGSSSDLGYKTAEVYADTNYSIKLPQFDFDCTPPPNGPKDSFTTELIIYSKKYFVAAQECVTTSKFIDGGQQALNSLATQFEKDMAAKALIYSVDAWNEFVGQVIANPVDTTTVNPRFATQFPNNILDVSGDASADLPYGADIYETLIKVGNYLDKTFDGFSSRFSITSHYQLLQDILTDRTRVLSYDSTGLPQNWAVTELTSLGYFKRFPTVRGLTQLPILEAGNQSRALYPTIDGDIVNMNPWEGGDYDEHGVPSKLYVIISSTRSFWTDIRPIHEITTRPVVAAGGGTSMENQTFQTFYAGFKVLVPEETFIIAFANPEYTAA